MEVSQVGEGALQIGLKLSSGVSCGPGALIAINSSGEGILASGSGYKEARGVALTSGAGTKTTGVSQYVRIDRHARVDNVDYVTLTAGNEVYVTQNGRYATSGSQSVGVALDSNTVWVNLDM